MGAKHSSRRVSHSHSHQVESDHRGSSMNPPNNKDSEQLIVSFEYQCKWQYLNPNLSPSSSPFLVAPVPPPPVFSVNENGENDEGSVSGSRSGLASRMENFSSSSSLESSGGSGGNLLLPNRQRIYGSFSCLSGAGLGANATLANTLICKGRIGETILPRLDSPRSFRRLHRSSSYSTFVESDSPLSSSVSSSTASSLSSSSSSSSLSLSSTLSAPQRMETRGFWHAADAQTAGGAAGEDRVQAVCSEENGWLFCAIYDGFNGRDAADFLAGTLYEKIAFHLGLLEWRMQQLDQQDNCPPPLTPFEDSFRSKVLKGLHRALMQTETEFLEMAKYEMEERQEIAMVGSCVLVILLHGNDLYAMNLGDSRAVLATSTITANDDNDNGTSLRAEQLTDDHSVDNVIERERLLMEHPDDPLTIRNDKVKGKLKLTRAFGAGYLKKVITMNVYLPAASSIPCLQCLSNAFSYVNVERIERPLMLRIRDLKSPPYVSCKPKLRVHRITEQDRFVVLGSDGLFDFFTNQEVVEHVDQFIRKNPTSDPAKYMLQQLLLRAATNAGMTVEDLKTIPIGRRRNYHDDVTIIVVVLFGKAYQTSSASTAL